MVELNKWGGDGKTCSTTQWGYRDVLFQVMRFSVDASDDGLDNPVTLIDDDLW